MEVQIIKMAISTLNGVEVKGKDNLSRMLGVIEALENVVKVMEQPPEAPMEAPVEEQEEAEDG